MNNLNLFTNKTNNILLQNISEKEMFDKVNGIVTMFQYYCQWLIVQYIVTIYDEGNSVSKPKHKVATQKQYLSGTIKCLEKKFKNIEMKLVQQTEIGHEIKAPARFISAGLAILQRTKNIGREVVIDICRYLARFNTLDEF